MYNPSLQRITTLHSPSVTAPNTTTGQTSYLASTFQRNGINMYAPYENINSSTKNTDTKFNMLDQPRYNSSNINQNGLQGDSFSTLADG